MTLTTHAVAGAALASLLPQHPVLGFAAGFASHFALDAIPHWNYHPRAASLCPDRGGPMLYDAELFTDIGIIALDGLIGIWLSLFLFASPGTLLAVLAGVLGGELPDLFHFIYTRMPVGWRLERFQQFHDNLQVDIFENRPWLGLLSQAGITAGMVLVYAGVTAL